MKIQGSQKVLSRKSLITKEVLIGILALGLGAYNLLGYFGYISSNIEIPQLIGNILLVLAGLFLLITAYKLSRYKHHTSHLKRIF